MKKFCEDLRTHASKITNCENKKMIPLTTEEKMHYNGQEFVIYARKNLIRTMKKIIK